MPTPFSGSFANTAVGETYSVAVTTSSATILAAGDGRTTITFANPGTVDVYVCQALDHAGVAITAAVNGAGTWPVIAGDILVINGVGNGAWNGIAASSAVLTIFVQ